ncbi:MAG: hypothetical protein ACYSWU_28855, partial [Planctomycetota bacterium]
MGALLSRNWWLPKASQLLAAVQQRLQNKEGDQDADPVGDDEAGSLTLSKQARRNIGLELLTIEPRDFYRTITVPAMVIERSGRTQLKISAQMTGIVTRIYPIRGEAVAPGQPLFKLRLTHEDL